MTHSAVVFANMVNLRHELSDSLDLRLRTDHDLSLELFELMTVIVSGEHTLAGIARRTGSDEPAATGMVQRLATRGLCLVDSDSGQAIIHGLTISGTYLFDHAAVAFDDQLHTTLGGLVSDEPAVLLEKILHQLLSVDHQALHHPRRPTTITHYG